ncbi:MAG: methyltransferase domain-containing protein [Acidimicrobiales bacterium]|nr:methyltransferase domain-containing protein [Acidimicrobiales bacterium]
MSMIDETVISNAADLLAQRSGLLLDSNPTGRLSRALTLAARAKGISCAEYVTLVETDTAMLQDLLDRVTIQETAFFRDPGQFEALATYVLPTVPAPITIWSAACSNGQEAYSLAMILAESGHVGSRVLGTDVSTNAIDRARRGRYSKSEIRGLSTARRSRYLVDADGEYDIAPELRARVEITRHNLKAGPPALPPNSCPVVFCRNVLIYFGRDDVRRLLDQIADWMGPQGWLFLGYSESLWHISQRFEMVRLGDAFAYRPSGQRRGRTATPPRATGQGVTAPNNGRRRASSPAVQDVPQAPATAVSAEAAEFLALGRKAMETGDHAGAVAAFRKSTYLDGDQPIAHFCLGLALERFGDEGAARRAYAAARLALGRSTGLPAEDLDGYHPDEVVRLLDRKLAGTK